MATVIDHLMAHHQVTIVQAFSDANGIAHRAGETGIIRDMGLDWPRQQIWIDWERDGTREKMVFRLDAKKGPRNGGMREFFELGDYQPPPRPKPAPPPPPTLPTQEAPDRISDEEGYNATVQRVRGFAAYRRFDEAHSETLKATDWLASHGWRIDEMAQHLTAMAAEHVEDDDPAVYLWLKQQATFVWYMWGSGATSGGEGAAFGRQIQAWEKALAELDRRRQSAGLRMNGPST
jgi:hypothetical protein